MRTIEISVNDGDFSKLRNFLSQLGFVKKIKEVKTQQVDATTILSEHSLAEEWNSKEDSRYEKYYKK
ncbi:hypothetical protein [Adhaeribacter soli]|uniref:Uncharacterized protein n=1 Tax=Adhaeribacter soli TaxID=2607655 RepID=A0A5N1J9S6_9BACT|nr:hypothetical protein [Adhaeribacter soli]KAA9346065.1 hypothetical protein F0P94_03005 [Adhaeribacter soli]